MKPRWDMAGLRWNRTRPNLTWAFLAAPAFLLPAGAMAADLAFDCHVDFKRPTESIEKDLSVILKDDDLSFQLGKFGGLSYELAFTALSDDEGTNGWAMQLMVTDGSTQRNARPTRLSARALRRSSKLGNYECWLWASGAAIGAPGSCVEFPPSGAAMSFGIFDAQFNLACSPHS